MSGSTHRPGGVGFHPNPPGFLRWRLLIALLAGLSVVMTLDPAGDHPSLLHGPGVTLDESLNVRPGIAHWRLIWEHGLDVWNPARTLQFFGQPGYPADYPPWGRIWLGVWHDSMQGLVPPQQHAGPCSVVSARVGSAAAYTLLILLCGWTAQAWFGGWAGITASLSIALMPRLWAHAHLAAVETILNLVYVATVLSIGTFWLRERESKPRPLPNSSREVLSPAAEGYEIRLPIAWAIVSGLLFGLVLLTKIQAVLLPLPLCIWACWIWNWRAILPLTLFGGTGLLVFLVGWPWLWLDPWQHTLDYFARTTDRIALDCFYLGREWADREVPWHYPWVMFLVTVPLGWHLLAVCGCLPASRQPAEAPAAEGSANSSEPWTASARRVRFRQGLLGLNILGPLLVFSLPGVAVYDGTRLFLMVFPLWGMLAGAGVNVLQEHLTRQRHWSAASVRFALVGGILLQSWSLFALHPCQLIYYNLLIGGLRGADRLGFELSYWGESLHRGLLEQVVQSVPEGALIDVAPVLHGLQLEDLLEQSPILREHQILLRAYDDRQHSDTRYALVFRRRADPWQSLEHPPAGAVLLAEVRREGVQLAALYEFLQPENSTPSEP